MTTSVYVAGASKEIERAEQWIRRLQQIGVRITHDWTVQIRTEGLAGRKDGDIDRAAQRRYAAQDFAGVAAADFLWALYPFWPEHTTRGLFYELAYAKGLLDWRHAGFDLYANGDVHDTLRPVVLISLPSGVNVLTAPPADDIFAQLIAREIFANDEAAFEYIAEHAAARRRLYAAP